MTLKKILLIIGLATAVVSCKTQSAIVTTKHQAQKLGIYQVPVAKKRIAKNNTVKSKDIKIEEITYANKLNHKDDTDYFTSPDTENYIGEQLINKGYQFLGTPYVGGGTSANGMDCSGFIIATFSDYNIALPRTSNEMSRTGIEIDKSQARKGDLIFFRTNGRSVINHVGMVIDVQDNDVKFIHSSTSKGVIISSTKEGYYGKTFAKINRVLNTSTL